MKWLTLIFCLLCSPCYAGVSYFENMDDITDWTDSDVGNGVSSQATFDSKSVMDLYCPTASSTTTASRIIQLQPFPTKYIWECKMYHASLGTRAQVDYLYAGVYGYANANYWQVAFANDGFFVYTSVYTEIGTDIVSVGSWDTWRLFIDSVAGKMWIWKNGVFVAGNISCAGTGGGAINSKPFFGQYCHTSSGRRTYIDYLRIYSEDGKLIQTIIE